MNTLDVCKKTRKIAADSLYKTLQKVLKNNQSISEKNFADLWLVELRKHREIFPDGWYIPPAHGIAVLFATEDNLKRVNYKSLRPQENWPQKNIFLDREKGFIYLFACPVNRENGLIGDFGITTYFGKNNKLKKHLKNSYQLTKDIFDHAQIGMSFANISRYSSKLCEEKNLINTIESSTDPLGTNIGHTIPSTDMGWTPREKEIFNHGHWEKVCKLISTKRIFLNESEKTVLDTGMGISIEPRPRHTTDASIPMASFHTIGLFYDKNKKELLTNFDKIFKLVGMQYMLQ